MQWNRRALASTVWPAREGTAHAFTPVQSPAHRHRLRPGPGACSRIDLAYRNLDRLVPWSLGDYLDMNREQKALLDDRLKRAPGLALQDPTARLPRLAGPVRGMVADDQVTDQALQQRTREAREAIGRVAEEITLRPPSCCVA
jgi:hypothetical protein